MEKTRVEPAPCASELVTGMSSGVSQCGKRRMRTALEKEGLGITVSEERLGEGVSTYSTNMVSKASIRGMIAYTVPAIH
jgi:hypothetical protein